MATKSKNRIRICADCKTAPAKGIRSKRCLECHRAYLRARTLAWNKKRSEEARKDWSPVCEYSGCNQPKRNNLVATKWCDTHLHEVRIQRGREYRQRRRENKIANPGKCENPGCTRDSYSYKAKYCSPCRAELRKTQNAVYRRDRSLEHDEKNAQIVQHVIAKLTKAINVASKGDALDTAECHRMGAVLLQLRAWGSR
jgi:hypothetical protein